MNEPSSGRLIFSADLGGTHLRAGLIDENGRIIRQVKQSTPAGEKPGCVVNALVACAAEMHSFGSEEFDAASVVVPGTVNREKTAVVEAPNLPSLDNFGLKAALERELAVPVLIENDANAAAVGEMWLGAGRGARNLICITLGTGVGGGIILDGKLWRGTDGSAGELGHTSVDPFNGPECKCGSTGCLEMFASATAIVRLARESLNRFPGTTLHDQCLTASKIYDAAKSGDELSLMVFKTVGKYLGVGLANLINILSPEVIVIGGGVANGWELFEGPMREEINKRAFSSAASTVKIKIAECGDNAGLLGAARLALDDLNNL
jgi:glucokinase